MSRFADLDGTLIDVYQQNTNMTDESGQAYPATVDALLDNAVGPNGYYGAFGANIHDDNNAPQPFDVHDHGRRRRERPPDAAAGPAADRDAQRAELRRVAEELHAPDDQGRPVRDVRRGHRHLPRYVRVTAEVGPGAS